MKAPERIDFARSAPGAKPARRPAWVMLPSLVLPVFLQASLPQASAGPNALATAPLDSAQPSEPGLATPKPSSTVRTTVTKLTRAPHHHGPLHRK